MSPEDAMAEEFERQFNLLLDSKLIEIVSINDDGEWLYQATEKGKRLYETLISGGLIGETGWRIEKDDE